LAQLDLDVDEILAKDAHRRAHVGEERPVRLLHPLVELRRRREQAADEHEEAQRLALEDALADLDEIGVGQLPLGAEEPPQLHELLPADAILAIAQIVERMRIAAEHRAQIEPATLGLAEKYEGCLARDVRHR